ncbi:RNA-binding (RRM/RBD/RNP motifs) family protein [Artemisia annua]|uniref:RNA-binding (RRM/RBD/RNP motifs) family protein n=1 Tax=Artemisia annua TaxID=35608 RepID=A0A2U1MU52_ARTAN|nr:RNA-binding (RRM/RBD/RNP motifs) family protein [Artemisia annua]
MTDSREGDDQVDFEDDNSEEEMDEEVEEQIEEEEEEEEDGNGGEENEEEASGGEDDRKRKRGDEKALGGDGNNEKHAELLALPPHGSEIFIGGLSKDVVEEDLSELCEPFGDVVEVRLVKNKDTNESKGFAFVAYKTTDVAQKAIKELHSKEYKGRTLRCSLSETKYRLFIGNVPKAWTEDEFRKVIEETGPGAELIELIKDPQNPQRNRGFAFVEYYNNACADYSRQKLASSSFKLDGNPPTVTWADPKITPDSSSAAAAQVKALYIKNIPENTSTEHLKELFQRYGEVTKVVMPPARPGGKRDFGFVHFADRSGAVKAVGEKYEVDGQYLEVVFAKPQSEKKPDAANPHHAAPVPNYIPHAVYGGFAANPYGAAPAYGVNPSLQQPMIYGRGPVPGGMQMVPMVLPDGQIGYVLQQPGAQMPAVRPSRRNEHSSSKGSGGTRGRGGSGGGGGYDDSKRGRYRPY